MIGSGNWEREGRERGEGEEGFKLSLSAHLSVPPLPLPTPHSPLPRTYNDFNLLHQASDRGDGDCSHHRSRRSHRDAEAATGAVPRDCSTSDHRVDDIHWG